MLTTPMAAPKRQAWGESFVSCHERQTGAGTPPLGRVGGLAPCDLSTLVTSLLLCFPGFFFSLEGSELGEEGGVAVAEALKIITGLQDLK